MARVLALTLLCTALVAVSLPGGCWARCDAVKVVHFGLDAGCMELWALGRLGQGVGGWAVQGDTWLLQRCLQAARPTGKVSTGWDIRGGTSTRRPGPSSSRPITRCWVSSAPALAVACSCHCCLRTRARQRSAARCACGLAALSVHQCLTHTQRVSCLTLPPCCCLYPSPAAQLVAKKGVKAGE